MTRPFIIYALPRSRTVWLSKFLTYNGWKCAHDLMAEVAAVKDIAAYLKQPFRGLVDTGLCVGWKAIRALVPEAKIITVHRPVAEVRASLNKFGYGAEIDLEYLKSKLDETAQHASLILPYEALSNVRAMQVLTQHCGQYFDFERWNGLKNANIQLDPDKFAARMARIFAEMPKHKALLAELASYN